LTALLRILNTATHCTTYSLIQMTLHEVSFLQYILI